MGKLERITVTMPEEMAAKLREAVESGGYATTSEVVREALRDWSDHQERRQVAINRIRDLVAESEGEELLDGPATLAEFRARYKLSRD
ncbi:MAG TPA: ribbon-helix-helix domain-containing protein [Croceibacterium sp.]|nr:ribbon-helix-helix domain-containing protein [Croceibacterium sp.]